MNRRSFIATITALAGVVLARIKAPAAPIAKLRHRGVTQIALEMPITAVRRIDGGLVAFSNKKAFTYTYGDSYGWRLWKHPISEQHGRLLTLNDYNSLVDTCKHCGAQAHPGYELICCCHHSPICECFTCKPLTHTTK